MGLAGPRKRVKLSHDPNNTKWTRDTTSFGHKIMTAQGWQPGEILGAKDASHAEFHTAANASHIRVFIKDDNLGLGAKKGSGLAEGECTGLDVFQSLLGRLNGKEEDELLKEQKSRDDLRRSIYSEQRWGTVRFVKGGFLVGDKIQKLIEDEEDRLRGLGKNSSEVCVDTNPGHLNRYSESESPKKQALKDEKKKKERQRVDRKEDDCTEADSAEVSKLDQGKLSGQDELPQSVLLKAKKSKKKRQVSEKFANSDDFSGPEEKATSTKSRKKKKRKKLMVPTESVKYNAKPDHKSASQSPSTTPGSSTPQSILSGRHAVRSRNIAQKRLAVLDITSLNQIFMIKQ